MAQSIRRRVDISNHGNVDKPHVEFNDKIDIAGHGSLIGSAVVRNLKSMVHANLLTRKQIEIDAVSRFVGAQIICAIQCRNTYDRYQPFQLSPISPNP